MRIVTGARPFIDIDAYGGIVAYAELLEKQGITCRGVSTSVLNGSVTPTVLTWQVPLSTEYKPSPDDTFTLIDVSNFEVLDAVVSIDRVDAIIDHHPGFEDFWQAKIGDKAHLELVGSACTLVYEHWVQAGLVDNMSQTSARLLICGILDNTLDFRAKLTCDRDRQAYKKLLTIANLPDDWTAQYFAECQAGLLKDVPTALDNDSKLAEFPGWEGKMLTGQLGIWDASELLGKHLPAMKRHMSGKGNVHWVINIIAISEGRSYFICEDPALQAWLSETLDLTFKDDMATADRMWLRKEIFKQAEAKEEAKS